MHVAMSIYSTLVTTDEVASKQETVDFAGAEQLHHCHSLLWNNA